MTSDPIWDPNWTVNEDTAYRSRDLEGVTTLALPNDANGHRDYILAMGTSLSSIDRTDNDAIAKWWAQCTNVTADSRTMSARLHANSQGLNRLDRWLGAKLAIPANLQHPVHGYRFNNYVSTCSNLQTAPKGRVMVGLMSCFFKVSRDRYNVVNQAHLLQIPLESYKIEDVRKFVELVHLHLGKIRVDELKDKKLLYD